MTTEKSYEGEIPWTLQDTVLGWLTLEVITSSSKGFLIAGKSRPYNVEGYKLFASFKPLTWDVWGNCSEGYGIYSYAALELGGAERICEFRILNDDKNQFKPFVHFLPWVNLSTPVTILVLIPESKYLNPTYDLQMLIKTSGGVRLVTSKPPEPLSDEERAKLEGRMKYATLECKNKYLQEDGIWGRNGRLDPHWIPDPPPNEVVEHLWAIHITGLQGAHSIIARDYEKNDVAMVKPTAQGEVHFHLLLTPSLSSNQITLLRQEGAESGSPQGDRNLFIKQILFVQKAILYLNEHCSWLSGGWYKDIPAIFAITASGLKVYDLKQPDSPILLELVPMRGLNGAMPWHRNLLIWGKNGLRLHPNGTQVLKEGRTVYDVLHLEQNLYISTNEGLIVLDEEFHQIGNLQLSGGRQIVGNGALLTINDGHNLHVINVSNPQSPQELSSYVVEDRIATMRQMRSFGLKNLFFAHQEKGGGGLFEIQQEGRPMMVAQFKRNLWDMGTVLLGDTLVHLDPDKRALKVLRTAQVHTL